MLRHEILELMAFLLAVIALVPLLIAPGALFYFDVTPKLAILLFGTAAAAVWWAARGPGAGDLLSRRAGRWLCVLLCAQAISLIVSATGSADPGLSWGGTNWRRYGAIPQLTVLLFAFLTATYLASDARRATLVLRVVAVTGIPVAAYGVLQYFGWDPWLPKQAYHAGEGVYTIVRPPGTLGHADYFATWCVSVLFTSVGLALVEKVRGWRMVAAVSAATAALAVILNGTRSALVGLLAGGALLALWMRPRFRARALLYVALLIAAGCLFYVSPAGALLRSRVHWATEDSAGGARLILWQDSLRMGAQRWGIGYGPETFSLWFPRFQSVRLAQAYPDFYQESPHNILLDALAAQGIVGPVLLLLFCALALHAGWRQRKSRLAAGLAASVAAAFVSQQFCSFTMPTALYFYLGVALLVGVQEAHREERGPGRRRYELAAVLPLAALLAVFSVRLLIMDRSLYAVQKNLDSGNIPAAIHEHDGQQSWPLLGANAELWYSRKLLAVAQTSTSLPARMQAVMAADRAARRAAASADDRQNACYNLAMFHALRNDAAGTEASLREAIRYAPNWFKPHWALAQFLARTGHRDDAAAEAKIAAKLNADKSLQLQQGLSGLQSQ